MPQGGFADLKLIVEESVAASERNARKGSFSDVLRKIASVSKHDSPQVKLPVPSVTGSEPNPSAKEGAIQRAQSPPFKHVCAIYRKTTKSTLAHSAIQA